MGFRGAVSGPQMQQRLRCPVWRSGCAEGGGFHSCCAASARSPLTVTVRFSPCTICQAVGANYGINFQKDELDGLKRIYGQFLESVIPTGDVQLKVGWGRRWELSMVHG